ncbi:MAG TPA: DUF6600 domain-containing protein [Kofleriaceae bacterium]|nr:DUF6600 domain-containing protein [Kofleriaceae bacterium]
MAQPTVDVSVDAYDTAAPGEPVEAVDVFYDQLSPYGVWVDEPSIGHVFIPEQTTFVPYTTGHWQYTSVGFVWVSSEPFAWATSHYGRWAFSQPYGRWVWLPDTEWGPAWVQWRQTGEDFGWAPLPPQALASYSPPIESWHYCPSAHVLDVDIYRHYEPRERVVVLHREARPIEHYATVSRVKVVVGPPAATLRERHITVRPVKVEAKVVGRVTQTEARAQVERARERKPALEEQNKKKIEANVKIKAVVEKQPAHRETTKVEPKREETKVEPKRVEPKTEPKYTPKTETKVEPKRETKTEAKPEPKREETKVEPKRVEPKAEPKYTPKTETKVEPKPPARVEAKPEPKKEIKPVPKPEPKKEPARTEKKPEPKPDKHADN